MAPKTKKPTELWVQCDNCKIHILKKNEEEHASDCPPVLENRKYDFIQNNVLYGTIDIKTNEEIKHVTLHDKDFMVFMSQTAMQMCNLHIGQNVKVDFEGADTPIARSVWPTIEKNLTSVLFTKNAIDLLEIKSNIKATVQEIHHTKQANIITLVAVNYKKKIDFKLELSTRLLKSFNGKFVIINNIISVMFYGRVFKFLIKNIEYAREEVEKEFDTLSLDNTFYEITENTKFKIYKDNEEYNDSNRKKVASLDEIGGMDDTIKQVLELMNNALSSNKSNKFSVSSALLYGIPGTGKTLLVNALSEISKVHVVNVNCFGATIGLEKTLDRYFDEVLDNIPCLVIFENFDMLCSNSNRMTETDIIVFNKLSTFFDNIENRRIFVLGTTNKIDSINSSFRRRFDFEMKMPSLNPLARFSVLQKLLKGTEFLVDESTLRETANVAHGFVGSDLVRLIRHAVIHAGGRKLLNFEDFKYALANVCPSAMQEIQIETPNVRWADIGGQRDLKLKLIQSLEWPLRHADSFANVGIVPPKGILMFGPPGCSKTMIAKAVATESGLNFLSVKGSELLSKYVGESEKQVRELFAKAKQVAPAVIFFDEIDAIGGKRSSESGVSVQDRVLTQLLAEMDGVTSLGDVIVLAATNRPDRIDGALLRPGRFDRKIYVPLPDDETRMEIFKLRMSKMHVRDVDLEYLVQKTRGYSGSDITAVCMEAGMALLEEDLNAKEVTMKHFMKALEEVSPSTPDYVIDTIYRDYV